MKKIALLSLLVTIITFGCKKGNEVVTNTASNNSEAIAAASDSRPTATFRIANLTSIGMILEANITDFQNLSQNGNSFHWDFGNGITSDEKLPQNISFAPCGGTSVISLTVTDKNGHSATTSQAFTVQCRGKHARHAPITTTVHLNTQEITTYLQNL